MSRLLAHELISRWKAVLGWSVGLVMFGALYIAIFPEAEEQMMSLADLTVYQAMGVSLTSFEGFLASVLILFLPLLLGIYAIGTATRTLAGEEDEGTLELLMAKPLHRWQIFVAKVVAIGVALIVILLLAGLGNAAVLAAVKMNYETGLLPSQMFSAVVSGWPITMALAAVAALFGTLVPSRRTASVLGALVLVGGYFGENASAMVESLKFMRPLSLFSYFDTTEAVFVSGQSGSDTLVLLAVIVVCLALALIGFQRRNITVGAWFWQRNRLPAQ